MRLGGHPHPHLPDRRGRGRLPVAEPAVQSQVDVQAAVIGVMVQQVLAVRLGVDDGAAGQQGRPGGEPALRALDGDGAAREQLAMAGGEAVDGVSLWHEELRYPLAMISLDGLGGPRRNPPRPRPRVVTGDR
ncbi:hypothetical protein KRM28CT15_59880 [Krasilnikovia sp. M28-CT-15]